MQTSASETGNPALDVDVERLRACGHTVEVVREDTQIGVVVRDYRLPDAVYQQDTTDLLLRTDIQYPFSAMDMFWVRPDLVLVTGGVPQGGESLETHFRRPWRRYSWHRNAPWVPGRDDLVGHFEFARDRLRRPE